MNLSLLGIVVLLALVFNCFLFFIFFVFDLSCSERRGFAFVVHHPRGALVLVFVLHLSFRGHLDLLLRRKTICLFV